LQDVPASVTHGARLSLESALPYQEVIPVDSLWQEPALPASTRPPATAAGLLELLDRSGGVVRVVDPSEQVRAAWRRLLHACKQGVHVPEGWHLRHSGRNAGDLVIELRVGEHPAHRYQPNRAPALRVPEALTDPHPIVDALRSQPQRLPASPTNRSRTLLLLEALIREAQRRGYSVHGGKESTSTLVGIEVGGQQFGVGLHEETGARWALRLCLNVHGPGQGRNQWADHAQRPLEVELLAILDEIAERGTRIAAEQELKQRQEAERQDRERQRLITEHRARILRDQVTAWRLAEDIRRHCADLVAAGLPRADGWLRWARDYADSLDPLLDPPGLPAEPTDDELEEQRREQRRRQQRYDRAREEPPRPWHPNRRWWHQK
jgi:hypothetical protein